MSSPNTGPVLYVVACGGRPAGKLPAFVSFAQEQGWDVCVIATPDGTKFLKSVPGSRPILVVRPGMGPLSCPHAA